MILRWSAGGLAVLFAAILPAEAVTVTADYEAAADYPLSKSKFAVYNSGFVPLDHYQRDLHMFREVKPPALRVDLWWGGNRWIPKVITGTSASLSFNFGEMDRMASLLNGAEVAPYWAYSYMPEPLQSNPGDYRSTPTSYQSWGDILKAYAAHAATGHADRRVRYHEIYNEPDNRDFFSGGLSDYMQLYEHGAKGIRSGDPQAMVGGPAIAFTDAWVGPFLEHVHQRSLPLDFFSFHFYPTVPYKSTNVAGVIRDMRVKLAQYPDLATTEMHLNEYNSYKIDYPKGGRQDRYELASAMLSDFHYFLTQPDLTMVNWAQFQDTGGGNWSGMISRDGHRKAVFNAYKLYQQMPEDRVMLKIEGTGIQGFASSDGKQTSTLLWNTTSQEHQLDLKLLNIPSDDSQGVKIYRIDAEHGSWGDNIGNEELSVVEEHAVEGSSFHWSSKLPGFGVVCFETTGSTTETLKVVNPPAVLRTYRHFPNRYTSCYSDFNERTLTFRLGSARETSGTSELGVLFDGNLQAYEAVIETKSATNTGSSAAVEVRLDQWVNGAFLDSIAYRWCDAETGLLPWETRRRAGKFVSATAPIVLLETQQDKGNQGPVRTLLTVRLVAQRAGERVKISLRPRS